MANILNIRNLSKNYGSKKALNSLDLDIEKGQVWGLLGPNGSGKTTTLGILLGVLRASSGEFTWFGEKPSGKSRRRIGSLLEQPNFYPWLSGEQNLSIVASIRGNPSKEEIHNKLEKVGLLNRKNDPVKEYSLGMKQRLGIAATLLNDPEVLVLDEPTNGIDAKGIAEIRNLILSVASEGKTILLASHILDEVEKTCSHVVVLKDGITLMKGSVSELTSQGTGIEVGSEELELLETKLSRHPDCKELKKLKSTFLFIPNEKIKASELNSYLVEQNVPVSHLSTRNQSLENQFLSLLEKSE